MLKLKFYCILLLNLFLINDAWPTEDYLFENNKSEENTQVVTSKKSKKRKSKEQEKYQNNKKKSHKIRKITKFTLQNVPDEVIKEIISYLNNDVPSLTRFMKTSKRNYKLTQEISTLDFSTGHYTPSHGNFQINGKIPEISDNSLEKILKIFPNTKKIIANGCEITNFGMLIMAAFLNNPTELSISNSNITDDATNFLRYFKQLKKLNLSENFLTDEGFEQISKRKKLTHLSVGNYEECNEITKKGLDYLFELKNLEFLKILGLENIDQDFKQIANLTKLSNLKISNCDNLTGEFLKFLNNSKLKTLNLEGCLGLEPQHLIHLKELKYLEHLDLSNSYDFKDNEYLSIQSKDLEILKHLKRLKALRLDYANGIKYLHFIAALKNLESLTLIRCNNIEPGEFKYLVKLKNLSYLDCSGVELTDEDIQTLSEIKNLKTLKITCSSSVTNKAFEFLSKLQLKELHIEGDDNGSPHITDECLNEIQKIKTLKKLSIYKMKNLTSEKADALKDNSNLCIVKVEN
jgi:hypothetical protein